jgi:FixJ family two-component response regulator
MPEPTPALPRVFLVDDQPQVLKALARVLAANGFDPVTFTSAQAFLDTSHAADPGCLVLDLAMPDMDGMALQRALVQRASLLPLVFLTGHGDMTSGVAAMKSGAFDFLSKPVDVQRLLDVVTAALAHNQVARAGSAQRQHAVRLIDSLSRREREVLALIVQGKLNKQVAAQLGTVEKTVKVQRASVMHKTGADSVAALVRLWDAAHSR